MSNWLQQILQAITGTFQTLGDAVLGFLKRGFVELFCEYTGTLDGTYTITGPSPIAYYVFIIMGISLVLGLTYYLVNTYVRLSRST